MLVVLGHAHIAGDRADERRVSERVTVIEVALDAFGNRATAVAFVLLALERLGGGLCHGWATTRAPRAILRMSSAV